MSSYDEMKSQGSFGQATNRRPERARNVSDIQTYPRHQRSLSWVDREFPDAGEWRHILATAARMVKRANGGKTPGRQAVLERVREQYGDALCDELGVPK